MSNFETGKSESAMKMSKLSMWAALTVLTLSMAACSSGRDYLFEGNEYSNPIKVNTIKTLYKERDACFAKNAIAADGENSTSPPSLSVALACAPRNRAALIAATNVDNDPKVAEAIRKDTDQKAAKYVEGTAMTFREPSRLTVLAPSLIALLLAPAIPPVFKGAGFSDPRLAGRIERAYEARDKCLAKNAVPSGGGEAGVSSVAEAVSLACLPETNQLIALTNPHQDPRVTQEIMRDSDAKAVRYVLLARGESVN